MCKFDGLLGTVPLSFLVPAARVARLDPQPSTRPPAKGRNSHFPQFHLGVHAVTAAILEVDRCAAEVEREAFGTQTSHMKGVIFGAWQVSQPGHKRGFSLILLPCGLFSSWAQTYVSQGILHCPELMETVLEDWSAILRKGQAFIYFH